MLKEMQIGAAHFISHLLKGCDIVENINAPAVCARNYVAVARVNNEIMDCDRGQFVVEPRPRAAAVKRYKAAEFGPREQQVL
ncbi:hypothetical protein ACFL4Q_01925, partial [candidate division KSB1 bacterium]